jgi:hypothetical protein
VSVTTATAGTIVTVSAPRYYLNEAGRFFRPSVDDVQAWWNLRSEDYASVLRQGISIANGHHVTPSGEGPQMLGDYAANGACSVSLRFRVPDVAAATYPVTVSDVGNSGSTAYGSFSLTVIPH